MVNLNISYICLKKVILSVNVVLVIDLNNARSKSFRNNFGVGLEQPVRPMFRRSGRRMPVEVRDPRTITRSVLTTYISFQHKNRRTFKHILVLVLFLNGLILLIDKI
jgi:hypothetical protein